MGGGSGFTFRKELVWDTFPKLSLYTQGRISIVPYFIGNTFGEVSITRELKWIGLYFTIHEYEKEVNIRDRAMASQRNLHTKGGAPRAERRGACINTLWKLQMSCLSMQTQAESSLSTRRGRAVKSSCWDRAEEL